MWNAKLERKEDDWNTVYDYYCKHCQNEFIIRTKYLNKIEHCPICSESLERIQ